MTQQTCSTSSSTLWPALSIHTTQSCSSSRSCFAIVLINLQLLLSGPAWPHSDAVSIWYCGERQTECVCVCVCFEMHLNPYFNTLNRQRIILFRTLSASVRLFDRDGKYSTHIHSIMLVSRTESRVKNCTCQKRRTQERSVITRDLGGGGKQ